MVITKSQRVFWTLLAVLLIGSLGFNTGLSQNGEDTNSQLPTGNWTVSAHPYFGPDHLEIPVVVFSVTSAELKRGAITEVGLLNRSSKPVDAVKLGWILTKEENRDTILLQGETRLLNIQSGLSVNQKQVLKFPVVTFAKIYKPLLKQGPLNGEFHIEIVVNEILYSDGTTWSRSEGRKVEFVKAANPMNKPTVMAQTGCAKQKCVPDSGGTYYTCQSSGTDEYCTNRLTSCTNTLCSAGGGGPGPDEPVNP